MLTSNQTQPPNTQKKKKVRFILAVVEGALVVSNRKKQELLQELAREGYELFGPQSSANGAPEGEEGGAGGEDATDLGKGYDYLLSMKIWSLTLEKVRGWVVGCFAVFWAYACLSAYLGRPSNNKIHQHPPKTHQHKTQHIGGGPPGGAGGEGGGAGGAAAPHGRGPLAARPGRPGGYCLSVLLGVERRGRLID